MSESNKIRLFRMIHIDNISHVIQHGITHSSSSKANPNFVPIGDGSIISKRNLVRTPEGGLLGDYIPFYFWSRMPMLYVIQKGHNGLKMVSAENIVYIVTSVHEIVKAGNDFAFTDGHAVGGFSKWFYPSDINEIENLLDFEAIKNKSWIKEGDTDYKRRKEAEFLLKGDLPKENILGYVVYSENAKSKLMSFGVAENQIAVKPEYYF